MPIKLAQAQYLAVTITVIDLENQLGKIDKKVFNFGTFGTVKK